MKRKTRMLIGGLFLFPLPVVAAAQQLGASDGVTGDAFGHAVAAWKNVVVVGAPEADVNGQPDQGAVYVYTRNTSGWQEVAKLVAGDGATGAHFGESLAMRGDVIVVGASDAGITGVPDTGAAYVFEMQAGSWTQVAKLHAPDAQTGDEFGHSVDVSTDGGWIVVGAPETYAASGNYPAGVVHAYARALDGTWNHDALVKPDVDEFQARFGDAVAIDQDMAVIGQPSMQDSSGALHFFSRSTGAWNRVGVVHGVVRGDFLGHAVAVSRREIGGSAPNAETAETFISGAVATFRSQRTHVSFTDGFAPAEWTVNGAFGNALDMNFDRLAVSDLVGNAFVFFRDGNDWIEQASFDLSANASDVAIYGQLLAVGDRAAEATYLYDIP